MGCTPFVIQLQGSSLSTRLHSMPQFLHGHQRCSSLLLPMDLVVFLGTLFCPFGHQTPHIFNMLAAQVRYMLCCDFLTVLNTCISPPQQHLGLRKWSLPSPGPAKSEAKRSKQTLRNRAISSSFKNLKKKIYHLRHNKLSIRCNRMETVEIATKVASYLAYFLAP